MSSLQHAIHTGVWTNWDQGSIRGLTLTLSQRDGAFLLTASAVFITLVTTQLWRLIVCLAHQWRSSKSPRDGLFYQQQVLLRNSATPGAAAWSFLRQTFAWNKKVKHVKSRTVPWAVVSALYLALAAGAAVFSSEISKAAGSSRLLEGGACGLWAGNTSADQSLITRGRNLILSADTLAAKSYASACYRDSYDPAICDTYSQRILDWTTNSNASCPFQPSMCKLGNNTAYQLTTALINSQTDLGINAPPDQRLDYQKRTNCAPLRTSGYTVRINGTTHADDVYQYYYGVNSVWGNSTHVYNQHTALDYIAYTVRAYTSTPGAYSFPWTPIDALNRTDADVTIVFLSGNSVRYSQPCDDPIFSAHVSQGDTWYTSDYPATVLGCTEQHRICNPNNQKCSPFLGVLQTNAVRYPLELNEMQQVILDRILLSVSEAMIFSTMMYSPAPLVAQDTLSCTYQQALPTNQWTIEVSSWFKIGLAQLQRSVVQYAAPNFVELPGYFLRQPAAGAALQQCRQQMVSDSQGTVSFSLLGLTLLACAGTVILIMSACIETCTSYLRTRMKHDDFANINWRLDDRLHLQRMAYQRQGWGMWAGPRNDIPSTINAESFGGWANLDKDHHWVSDSVKPHSLSQSESDLPSSGVDGDEKNVVHEKVKEV